MEDIHYVDLKTQRAKVENELTAWKNLPVEEKKIAYSILSLQQAVYTYFYSARYAVTHDLEELQTVICISKEVFDILHTAYKEISDLIIEKQQLFWKILIQLEKTPDMLQKLRNEERIDKDCLHSLKYGLDEFDLLRQKKLPNDGVSLDYEGWICLINDIAPHREWYPSMFYLENLVCLGESVSKALEEGHITSSRHRKRKREEGDGSGSSTEEGDGSGSSTEEGDGSGSGNSKTPKTVQQIWEEYLQEYSFLY